MCSLISQSGNIWSKLTSRAAVVEMVVALEEGNLSIQMWLVTSVSKRDISRNNAVQRELALVGTHPRSPQMSFHNFSLRSLFFHIPNILQQPPWPSTATSKSGATIEIRVIVNVDFNGMIATRSEKISKARNHMFIFPNPAKNSIIYCSYLMTTSE